MHLKEMREKLGKTQAEMAELLGITRNYLALIEIGKRPEPSELLAMGMLIVNKASADLSKEEWRERALSAEAKLASLKKAMQSWLNEI